MPARVSIETFLELGRTIPIVDVRSPMEYSKARIPSAINLPLFADVERAEVGTLYKIMGKEKAIERALELVSPKLHQLVENAKRMAPERICCLHCWRGGMRSESVSGLLESHGFRVHLLTGGYKSFRRWTLDRLEMTLRLHVLGGKTGSGKTEILRALRAKGAQVLDLEGIAKHKGSAFGGIGRKGQPTQAQFENEIAMIIKGFDPSRPIWVEDESRRVGPCMIPDALWRQMRQAPVAFVIRSKQARINRLAVEYGNAEKEELIDSLLRIQKRFGSDRVKKCIDLLESGHIVDAIERVLAYYDKGYKLGLEKRGSPDKCHFFSIDGLDAEAVAKALLDWSPPTSE